MEEENPATTEQQPERVPTPPVDPAPGSENNNSVGDPMAAAMDGEQPETGDMEGEQDPSVEEASAVKIDYSQDQSKN